MAEKPIRDRRVYVENRRKFTPEQLRPYEGRWVAWSVDGARIVAHHEDLEQLVREIDASGVDREDVVFDRIPTGGIAESLL